LNKSAMAWLVVRVFGVISLGLAAHQLYVFTLNFIVFLAITKQESLPGGSLRLVNLRWDPLFGFVFFSLLSTYLLKCGQAIHRLLIKEGGESEKS
jgi:hypothetical protein